MSLPHKLGGIPSISSSRVLQAPLSLPRKLGGISSVEGIAADAMLLSLPRKLGGIPSEVFYRIESAMIFPHRCAEL